MSDIPLDLRLAVTLRARNRCEYCQLSQVSQEAVFHVDHVLPRVAGGLTELSNLALACVSCSLRKGHSQVGTNPETGLTAPLFNPRKQVWSDHFRWADELLLGLTPSGLATLHTLALNRSLILAIRREEIARGRHPADPAT